LNSTCSQRFIRPFSPVAPVKFEGYKKTRLSALEQRVRLDEGQKLDRAKVEEAAIGWRGSECSIPWN